MGVQTVLAVLLMFVSTVKTDGGAAFWRNEVTLTCPGEGTWYKDYNDKSTDGKESRNTFKINYEQPLKYYCEYDSQEDASKKIKYFFYIKGKTCENCFELDAIFFMLAIIVDVVGTGVVMMIIFKCTKKRSSDGPSHSSKPPAPSGSRPPPTVPSRDYEQLNPRTRAAETYSTVVNRMG